MKIYAGSVSRYTGDVTSLLRSLQGKGSWILVRIMPTEEHEPMYVQGRFYIRVVDVYNDNTCRINMCSLFSYTSYAYALPRCDFNESHYEYIDCITPVMPFEILTDEEFFAPIGEYS